MQYVDMLRLLVALNGLPAVRGAWTRRKVVAAEMAALLRIVAAIVNGPLARRH